MLSICCSIQRRTYMYVAMGRLQKQVVGVGLRRVNAVIAACVCLLNSSTTAQPVRACVNALAVNQPINQQRVRDCGMLLCRHCSRSGCNRQLAAVYGTYRAYVCVC